MRELNGARVLVVGLGDSGLSMARWAHRMGAIVRGTDTRTSPPGAETLKREFPDMALALGVVPDDELTRADMVAVSPGVDRRTGSLAQAARRGIPVVGDVEMFARAIAGRDDAPPVIAITGSNGKSTVTAMAGAICTSAGLKPMVAGNIGLPVLDAWLAVEEGAAIPGAVVLELSSFQLESTISLRPQAATVLNISEDHLDRYDSLAEYAEAKRRIFADDGIQIVNRGDRWSAGMRQPGRRAVSFGLDMPRAADDWGIAKGTQLVRGETVLAETETLRVRGLHNAANALAAGALCRAIGVTDDAVVRGWQSFGGLPHRAKLINKINNIDFIDDSKGTNVGATVAALTGMRGTVVLIAGGDGKGQDFAPLAAAVHNKARSVVLIGRDAGRIADAIGDAAPVLRANDMTSAVGMAFDAAHAGDAVLLSPACASYDMFRNYIHRAEAFAAAVEDLQRRHA